MHLKLILSGIVIVGAVTYLIYRSNRSIKRVAIENEKVDKLTMAIIVQWFQSDEIKSELAKNPNLHAVVFRGRELEKYVNDLKEGNHILVGIFNNSTGEIMKGKLFSCKSIDQELLDLFGEKDLLILK